LSIRISWRFKPPVNLSVLRYLAADGSENDVLRLGNTDRDPEPLAEFGLVGYECVAPKSESARFDEQNQTEGLDVNHQRELPNVCPRVATRASRKSAVSMRIQGERISWWSGAEPIRPVCGSSQLVY
jgi:hypothetical protein